MTMTEEEKEKLTREAIKDVENGKVIDHKVVKEWADNLGKNKDKK